MEKGRNRIIRNLVYFSFITSALFGCRTIELSDTVQTELNTKNRTEKNESFVLNKTDSISEGYHETSVEEYVALFNALQPENTDDPFFTETDVQEFLQLRGSVNDKLAYVEEIVSVDTENTLDGFSIRRYYQLGVESHAFNSFQDTEKPNMLYIVPRYDPLPIRSFETEDALTLFNGLKEVYDTAVVVASRENEIYQALEKLPALELIVLGGHGTSQSIQLGYDNTQTIDNTRTGYDDLFTMDTRSYERIDELMIDVRDRELEFYLSNLPFRSTLFLNSCSNGEKGQEKRNLANSIMEMGSGHIVISATGPFSAYDVELRETYPLDIQIVVDRNLPYLTYNHDSTYNITYSNRTEDRSNTDYKEFYVVPDINEDSY